MRHVDLRQLGDDFLSRQVMNTEYLFKNIRDLQDLKLIIDDLFLYNDSKLAILQTDIKDYLFEVVQFDEKKLG